MSPAPAFGRIPPRIEAYLRSSTVPPFTRQGAVTDVLHDSSLINNIRDLADCLIEAAAEKRPVAIESDARPGGIAAAAILRALCGKLGSPAAASGRRSLLKEIPIAAPLRLAVREATITALGKGGMMIQARSNSPPYPSPDLSPAGLALKVVDAVFCAGALPFPSDFVAFDLETTGKNPRRDEIIEIGAVKVRRGEEIGAFSSFVKPEGKISPEIVGITGITPEMVKNAPPAAEALAAFLRFIEDHTLVAHNVPFDLAFLRNQARLLLGREFACDTEDTLTMARWLYPDAPNHRLGDIAALLHVPLPSWHRAESDARTASGLYLLMRERDRTQLRDLRLKHYLDLAALGTIAAKAPLRGENEAIVKHGLAMMLRRFSPWGDAPGGAVCGDELIDMLLSLDDEERRRAALRLLACPATTGDAADASL